MTIRKAITILVILIALILAGTVVVLTTVVSYFGVDSRDVIQEFEMLRFERLARQAKEAQDRAPGPEKDQKVVVGGDRAVDGSDGLDVSVVEDGERDASVTDMLNRLDERGWFGNSSITSTSVEAAQASTANRTVQPRIPKIIHATWKTDTLPQRWEDVRQGCIDMHPDYEFMLWSDASSRAFIAEHYSWFLSTFDGYTYPIQRADTIRYFLLHHFGGVYMDLDIGCRRNLDPLLYFQVILPATIPVGVSNDLMFSEKGHPFMELVIHNLITFDHTYGTNYPTVMFSTGPMFLSAQYGLWPKDVDEGMERQVRVLPRRWYGKNAPETQMEDSYFDHFYGSSWHADDAGFITFLGKFGMALMYAGLLVVVLGVIRIMCSKRPGFKATPRQLGPIALPYEALPFVRPGTPGSRPSSPFEGSRSGTPPGRGAPAGKGGVFYMPVWLFPSGEGRSPGARTPPETQGNWSQYFSNLSFVEDGSGHRYQPVPNFSRPPSPSNNSILHAPGSVHDGAFDGTPLHSIHAPKAIRPFSSRPSLDSEHSAPSQPPLSPNPPAYSALRSWGTSLFRGSPFTSPRSPLLPLSNPPSAAAEPSASHKRPPPSPAPGRASFSTATSPRPLSPAPPAYAAALGGGSGGPATPAADHVPAAAAGPVSPALVDPRGRLAGAGAEQPGVGRGASPSPAPTAAGHRTEHLEPAVVGGDRAGSTSSGPRTDELEPARSGSVTPVSRAHSRRGSAVEQEVDRLLNEMAPEEP
ncbi:hypothetical protein JCM10207_005021 [Rhodosporidiobolus poonsookiae]